MSIYHHFRRGHESSGFRKLAVNKWICEKNLRLISLKQKKKLTEKREMCKATLVIQNKFNFSLHYDYDS